MLNMFKKNLTIVAAVFMLGGFLSLAITPQTTFASPASEIQGGTKSIGGDDPSNQSGRVMAVIKNVINVLLFIIGTFAVIMIIIAGLRFVTSNGDSNTITQAKNTIIYAVIGIIVAVMAYGIVNFIVGQLT